jgi:hypothetical protein
MRIDEGGFRIVDTEDRKRRIAELLATAKPKKQKTGRKISFNGDNNIIVVGGDVTIGRKTTNGRTREPQPPQRVWREEARIAIRERAFQLKLTEDQVVALAQSLLRKSVPSLDSLSAAELGRVFDSMHNMKRPALD